MKHIVICGTCHDELIRVGLIPQSGHYDASLDVEFTVEYGNDFVLLGECPKGHRFLGYLQKERYDILFESAVQAYLSGFELEAILGFAAALERAQELYIWVSLHAKGVALEDIEVFWKAISSQSERQLGAFLSQWLLITGSQFPVDPKMSAFRNRVAHKGQIPLQHETREYASWVTDRLFDIVESLRVWGNTFLLQVIFFDREKRMAAVDALRQSRKEYVSLPRVSINPAYLTNLNHGDSCYSRNSFDQVCSRAQITARFRA